MADIFISYTHKDQEWAAALARGLVQNGWDVWWDQHIYTGVNFERVTEQELEKARCVIVLWSSASKESDWVRAEATEGLERNILVPVCIEKVRPPLKFRGIQTASLVGWNYSPDEPMFGKIMQAVERSLMPSNGLPGQVDSVGKQPGPEIVKKKEFATPYTDAWGIEYELIQPGTFMMGSDSGRENEKPVHKVTITRPFYMGKYPVTEGQFRQVMEGNPGGFQKRDFHPVNMVSWNDAKEFIKKMNDKDPGCRLPTEAEWEYACRAGTKTAYSFGDDVANLRKHAWYDRFFFFPDSTYPVGQRKSNPWGICDMHGNIWEWVEDWYGMYDSSSVTDPEGLPSGLYRVIRGGCWRSSAERLRSAYRDYSRPEFRDPRVGFRVVRKLP